MTCWHRACCSVNKAVDAPGGGHLTLREPRVGDGERRDAPWHQHTAWAEQVFGKASLFPPFPVAAVHNLPRTVGEICLPS